MFQILLLICTFTLVSVYTNNSSNTGLEPKDGGALCETDPSHILCLINLLDTHLPLTPTRIVHCDIFVLSKVHCCKEFCKAGSGSSGGKCDKDTGACFCEPSGEPKNCPVLTIPAGAPGYPEYEAIVAGICVPKCLNNTLNSCTSTTSVTAGPLGTVCMCYCP